MKTAKQYCNDMGIHISCEWADNNPNMYQDPERPFDRMTHYKVTLRRYNPRKQLTCYISMGMAHTDEPTAEEPTAEDVIGCLASDAQSVRYSRDFADWAGDLGYHPHDEQARRTYEVCQKQTKKLENFLGEIPELEW